MEFLTSNSTRLMEKTMSFLWAKQTALLDNISNAETPNYKEKIVTFEESLRERLLRENTKTGAGMRGAIENATWTVQEAEVSTRFDDNGINVTEQSIELVRNAYQLQYTMQSISSDLATLRSAIQG